MADMEVLVGENKIETENAVVVSLSDVSITCYNMWLVI